jgi:hypothetical protein
MLPSFSDGQPESIAQDIENMVHLYVDKVLTLLQLVQMPYIRCSC